VHRYSELRLADTYRVIVHRLLERGKLPEAVVGLRLLPRDPMLWFQFGLVLRGAGHPTPALVAFT
jgi:hypothetical protein